MISDPNSFENGFFDPFFARFYEQTDNTRQIDLDFYLNLARNAGGRILDAGCGSGRLLIPMVEAGLAVDGFDASPVMLETLHQRLAGKGLEANTSGELRVWKDELESFSAPNSYALIICAFNTFLHLMSHETQLEALGRFRRALLPEGKFVFDITNPPNFDIFSRRAMAKTFEATLYDPATESSTAIWRWFERDLVTQHGIYHREYQTNGPGGPKGHRTQVAFRWTYPEEMALLLELAGFERKEVFGDYAYSPLTEESEMQVWVCNL